MPETKNKSKFQKWMTKTLRKKNMSSAEMAARIGIHDSMISHYLRGTREPTYSTLLKIKAAFPSLDMNKLF